MTDDSDYKRLLKAMSLRERGTGSHPDDWATKKEDIKTLLDVPPYGILYEFYFVGKGRIKELEDAVRYHAEQRGDDRCFLDDLKLYRLIGIDEHPGLALSKEEFTSNCARFWECQQTGKEYKTEE